MARTAKLTAEEKTASERRVRKEREWAEAACSEKIARLRALRLARETAEKEIAAKAAGPTAKDDPSLKIARIRSRLQMRPAVVPGD